MSSHECVECENESCPSSSCVPRTRLRAVCPVCAAATPFETPRSVLVLACQGCGQLMSVPRHDPLPLQRAFAEAKDAAARPTTEVSPASMQKQIDAFDEHLLEQRKHVETALRSGGHGAGAGPSGGKVLDQEAIRAAAGLTSASGSPIVDAVTRCDYAAVVRLVQLGADPNKPGAQSQSTALHWAAHLNNDAPNGQLRIAAFLCGATPSTVPASGDLVKVCRADVNVRNNDGQTAIVWAARNGSLAMVQLLVAAGADHKVLDRKGFTILHHAAQMGHCLLLDYLMSELGMPLDAQDHAGHVALHWAAYAGQHRACTWLLRHGADALARDKEQCIPLHWAALQAHQRVMTVLLDAGRPREQLDAVDRTGMNAEELAAEKAGRVQGESNVATYQGVAQHAKRLRQHVTAAAVLYRFVPCLHPKLRRVGAPSNPAPQQHQQLIGAASSMPLLRKGFLLLAILEWLVSFTLLFRLDRLIVASSAPVVSQLDVDSGSLELGVDGGASLSMYDAVGWHWSCSVGLVAVFAQIFFWVRTVAVDPGCILPGDATHDATTRDRVPDAGRRRPRRVRGEPGLMRAVACEAYVETMRSALNNVAQLKEDASDRLLRPFRSKHCAVLDRAVLRFDHFCPWMNNAIGANNHRAFIFFLAGGFVGSACWVILGWHFLAVAAPGGAAHSTLWQRATGNVGHALWISHYMFYVVYCGIMLVQHFGLILSNQTTNEMIKGSGYAYLHDDANRRINPFDQGPVINAWNFFFRNHDNCLPARAILAAEESA